MKFTDDELNILNSALSLLEHDCEDYEAEKEVAKLRYRICLAIGARAWEDRLKEEEETA